MKLSKCNYLLPNSEDIPEWERETVQTKSRVGCKMRFMLFELQNSTNSLSFTLAALIHDVAASTSQPEMTDLIQSVIM